MAEISTEIVNEYIKCTTDLSELNSSVIDYIDPDSGAVCYASLYDTTQLEKRITKLETDYPHEVSLAKQVMASEKPILANTSNQSLVSK